ncbi:MAG: clan AA aspartic protease [Calditrichaeota bacterium]|nr:clan AA aspartic protease [Calditrichota bacterium]
MGTTYARVTVTPVGSTKRFTGDFLVNTGATDSVLPREKAAELGIQSEGSMRYEMADGRRIAFEYGFARFEVLGRTAAGKIIFGPEGCEPLLGVTILESAALRVNRVTKKLEKLPAALLK